MLHNFLDRLFLYFIYFFLYIAQCTWLESAYRLRYLAFHRFFFQRQKIIHLILFYFLVLLQNVQEHKLNPSCTRHELLVDLTIWKQMLFGLIIEFYVQYIFANQKEKFALEIFHTMYEIPVTPQLLNQNLIYHVGLVNNRVYNFSILYQISPCGMDI